MDVADLLDEGWASHMPHSKSISTGGGSFSPFSLARPDSARPGATRPLTPPQTERAPRLREVPRSVSEAAASTLFLRREPPSVHPKGTTPQGDLDAAASADTVTSALEQALSQTDEALVEGVLLQEVPEEVMSPEGVPDEVPQLARVVSRIPRYDEGIGPASPLLTTAILLCLPFWLPLLTFFLLPLLLTWAFIAGVSLLVALGFSAASSWFSSWLSGLPRRGISW